MKKAFSYIRFSTPEQLKGDSYRRQLERTQAYADAHQLSLDERLTFRDLGVSGYTSSNLQAGGGLRAFIDAIDQGVIPADSYLLVEALDRLTRAKHLDALELFSGLLRRGITIVSLIDGMVYTKDKINDNFTDLLISIAHLSLAHKESAQKADRLKQAWQAKRTALHARKLTKWCPAWLRLSDDRASYEFIPEKVEVVRQIIAWSLAGIGKASIAKRLNLKNIPSIEDRTKDRDGSTRKWWPSYVTKILDSRALIGEFQPHEVKNGSRAPVGDPVPNYFPRLLSVDEFELLQHRRARRAGAGGRRGHQFSNLFTGLVRCGYCYAPMVYVNKGQDKRSNRNTEFNRFLVCSNAKRGVGCVYIPWNYAELEAGVLNYAQDLDFRSLVLSTRDPNEDATWDAKLEMSQAKLTNLATSKANIIQAIEGGQPPQTLVNRLRELEREEDAAEAALERLKREHDDYVGRSNAANASLFEFVGYQAALKRDRKNEELYELRAKANEYLRRMLKDIRVMAGGTVISDDELRELRAALEGTGRYTRDELADYVKRHVYTKPNRNERFLVLRTHTGAIRVLRPLLSDPIQFKVAHTDPTLVRWWQSPRAFPPEGDTEQAT